MLFLAFWAGLAAIAYYAVQYGNLDRLVYGDDYQGNVCGRDNRNDTAIVAGLARRNETAKDHRGKPNTYYLFAFSTDAFSANAPRVCVPTCPNVTSLSVDQLMCLYPFQANASLTDVSSGRCFFSYASTPVLNRCVPQVALNATSTAASELGVRDMVEQAVAAVYVSGFAIGLSLLCAFVLGLVWLILMRFFAGVTVWFTIWAAILSLAVVAAMLWLTADELERAYLARTIAAQLEADRVNFLALRYISYIVAVVDAVALLVVIFNGRNIQLTITLCEEASKCLVDMPWLIAFPLIPFALIAALTCFFGYVGLYLATAADVSYSASGEYQGYDYTNELRGMGVFLLMGYLWTANLLLAIQQTTTAGCIADWYYSFQGKQLRACVVTRAFIRTIFYSLGSLALGSFILALVETFRVVLAFIQARLKLNKESKVAEGCLHCLQCCLACFQRTVEFLNKHAYIMIAIYGYSFCQSARRGFGIVVTNPIQVATIHAVSELIMFLGKMFVTACVTAGAFVYLRQDDTTHMWFVPVIFIALASFFLSSCFMLIYDTGAPTLLSSSSSSSSCPVDVC